MVHYNKKKQARSGFTMVELMVVLAITAILAALVGGGLIAYIRLARFEKNEANARTLFQTAQIALTRLDTAGELDDFRQKVLTTGEQGDHFAGSVDITDADGHVIATRTQEELNRNIYALYLDKDGDETGSGALLRDLLDKYVYDESLLNAAVCVEIDYESGQVYSVFYDTNSDKLRFNRDDATNIYDRSYEHRRSDSLVGYYSAVDRVNVVELQQTKLKVKNPRLSNNETLTLSWGGDETRDANVKYIATAYAADDDRKLFEIEVELPSVKTDKPLDLKTILYDEDGNPANGKGENYTFPLSYNKGNFVLTLDAMADADLLRSCENTPAAAKTSLYSITRLLPQGTEPLDFYMTVQAQPKTDYADSYTASEPGRTDNEENTLFAQGSTAQDATLKYFRHLYNLRWAESEDWDTGDNATYKLVAQGLGANGLNWTGGSVTVYTAPETAGGPSVAQVPSKDNPVAWPTIPTLSEKITLTSDTLAGATRVPLINMQFRGSSVAAVGRAGDDDLRDRYIGLVGENDGTIENITLRDVDLQVNVESKTGSRPDAQSDDELWLNDTTVLTAMQADGPDKNDDYRDVRAVGALCGVNTGTLKNCTLTHGKNNAYTAQVLAMLPFDDKTTVTDREAQKTAKTKKNVEYTYYKDEPRGIGGLVGVAMPKDGAEMSGLTVETGVTVAGLLQDTAPQTVAQTTQYDETAEQTRYRNAAATAADGEAAGETVRRSIGVGGVFGTLDAANMTADADPEITNAAAVTGNGFVGGIAGNLYNSSPEKTVTLTNLANTGTVTAGANYKGDTAGEHSLVLGQFFGGVAGYSKDVTLVSCTSTTNSTLTDSRLTTEVQAGYTAKGALKDTSPLRGDFVGGLVGFGNNITLTDCTTQKGYVLGNRFVGGLAGGFTGSELHATGGVNGSIVLGNRYVGGIVSVNGHNSTVENMTNSGLVAGLGKNAAYVGGIAGLNDAAWGGTAAASGTATIRNCTNSMASDNATNTGRINLLRRLSTYGVGGEAVYADYVGGLVGSNGKNGVLTWEGKRTDTGTTLSMGAILYGKNFVGGIAGYNDATAQITNTAANASGAAMTLTVTGQVVAEGADGGKAVGGMIGLNCAESLPAVNVRATKIQGVHFVGGVIGANMPVYKNGFSVENGTFTAVTTAGRVIADGLAGGVIGYNCQLSAVPAETDRTKWLPTVDDDTGLVTVAASVAAIRSTQPMTFTKFENRLNIEANAYVGGIVGYSDAETRLTISGAVNGSETNAASMGGIKPGPSDGTLYKGVRLAAHENTSYNFEDARGYLAGGVIGYVSPNVTLEDCTNYGTVSHTCAAGGLAGWNEGTIQNGTTYASIGSQQNEYRYLGGIAGVNGVGGKIVNSAPASDADVIVRGGSVIGGVAGINLTGASIEYTGTTLADTVQANYCAGGAAGVNCGTVTLGENTVVSTAVTVNTQYAGGIVGSNNTRNGVAGTVTGGKIKARVTSSGTYAGGAAGANYGSISKVAVLYGTRVRANDRYAGGIAGINSTNGTIENCANTANAVNANDYVVYATNGAAGGIAGTNETGGTIRGVQVGSRESNHGVHIGTANGTVGGIAETNRGLIETGTIDRTTLTFTGSAVGAAVTYNTQGAVIRNVRLPENAGIAFQGGATTVGGIAGRNNGLIQKNDGTAEYTVAENALNLSGLTANADTVTFGGAVGINEGLAADAGATVDGVTVALSVTSDLNRYKNLGGVAGANSAHGTLLGCAYTGALGYAGTSSDGKITVGATTVGDTVGGVVGLNDGTVNGCSVPGIKLQVQGASGLSDSQTTAQKLESASHVGGIAGRNNGTVTASYVADTGSAGFITARYGFVGGIAGSNSGTITHSGSAAAFTANGTTLSLVDQVNAWLTTENPNTGINAMVADMKNGGTGTYAALQGKDAVSEAGYGNVYKSTASGTATAGLPLNDLLVGLRGSTTASDKSVGYLGGITGFNSVSGIITDAATGKWFVYGDNTTADSKVGGMIGMNEATGDLKTLVNCAAVRRFYRNNKNDDDTTNSGKADIAYVGGIIGVQQNTNDDKWVLSNCVNYGNVFDSGSNFLGGIIASWLKNGGTIQKSFNFGNLSTNTNSGDESGTIGGIVGYFDRPTPGGTANILSCQNHGNILSRGNWKEGYYYGANDIAGILGKVLMASGANDYLRINIVDCVNGRVTMQSESLAAGILGWLGPWGDSKKGISNPEKVEVYIDRCRNYATDIYISPRNPQSVIAGISGNRGNGSKTEAATTITNCFALYSQNGTGKAKSYKPAPIVMNRNSENIVAYGNYFMDEEYSFNDTYNKAFKALKENEVGTRNYGETCADNYNYGTRLFAGIDNSKEAGTKQFFAAGMMDNLNAFRVDTEFCYIRPETKNALATIYRQGSENNEYTNKDIATILLWYSNAEGSKAGPDSADITDELIQNYYATMLDTKAPGKSNAVNVAFDNSGTSVYGRYEVTWDAPTIDGVFTNNSLQNVKYYQLTMYKCDDDGNILTDTDGKQQTIEAYTNLVVYGTRNLIEPDEAMAKEMGTATKFRIGIKAVSGAMKVGEETLSAPVTFMRPLPTPELEVRLEKKQTSSGTDTQPYGQYLVLKNAAEYTSAMGSDDWTVEAYLLNDESYKITFTANNTEAPLRKNGLGALTRLRATAIPGTSNQSRWMQSARYDEEIAVPATFLDMTQSDGKKQGNPGLVHGDAFALNWNGTYTDKGKPEVTGTTTDDLAITVNLSFAWNNNIPTIPRYRVILLGRYTGNATIGDGQSLNGQYITLASAEGPVYSDASAFVLKPPQEAFSGDYTDFQVISIPVTAGYSQVVTRWDATEAEAAAAIAANDTNPISWYSGIEIVREADGSYSYAHMTPLQFYAPDDPWGPNNTKKPGFIKYQMRQDTLSLNILPAPTVSADAAGELNAENKLYYTFTWQQKTANGAIDTTKRKYDVTLYGMLSADDDSAKEKIEFADGVSLTDTGHLKFDAQTGTYTMTFCVDDELANGSTAWRYDRVSLHVTRLPDSTDTYGAADEAVCKVLQRLTKVDSPNGINFENDNSADALHYTIGWPNTTGSASYNLYAERLAGNNADGTENWVKLDEEWPYIVGTSTTVDLERYRGETLRFYVIANRYAPYYENGAQTAWVDADGNRVTASYDADGSLLPPAAADVGGFGSPNGGTASQEIANRLSAPTVSEVTLSIPNPSQTQFLSGGDDGEQLQFTVTDGRAASYYYTGYLFRDYDDYKAVAAAAAAWQNAQTADDKAARLAELQTTLNGILNDTANPDRALRILTDSTQFDGGEGTKYGTETPLSGNFTMKPAYARYWLLPALRSMVPDGSEVVSSNWCYYVPGDYDNNEDNAMRLPAITLDTPKADTFATAGMTVTAKLFGEGDIPWNPAEQSVDISRYAVEWAAVNFYDKEEPARNLANTYHAEIVSADGATTDSYTITVAAQDVTAEDGTVTVTRGDILSVAKHMTVDDVDEDVTLPANTAEDGHTYYDLTWTVKVGEDGKAVYDENGNLELERHPVTLEGHCTVTGSDDKPRFKIEAFTMLEKIDMDGQPGYRITLPDLEDRLSADDTLRVFTSKVSVRAEGDPEKTVKSDTLTLERQDTTVATFELLQGEMPVQTETVTESVSDSVEDATDDEETPYIATPETAAPKKPTEEDTLPAVG